jgi:hypothetical protein
MSDSPQTILLCDNILCDGEFHMQCLTPPLEGVPLDDWCVEGGGEGGGRGRGGSLKVLKNSCLVG